MDQLETVIINQIEEFYENSYDLETKNLKKVYLPQFYCFIFKDDDKFFIPLEKSQTYIEIILDDQNVNKIVKNFKPDYLFINKPVLIRKSYIDLKIYNESLICKIENFTIEYTLIIEEMIKSNQKVSIQIPNLKNFSSFKYTNDHLNKFLEENLYLSMKTAQNNKNIDSIELDDPNIFYENNLLSKANHILKNCKSYYFLSKKFKQMSFKPKEYQIIKEININIPSELPNQRISKLKFLDYLISKSSCVEYFYGCYENEVININFKESNTIKRFYKSDVAWKLKD